MSYPWVPTGFLALSLALALIAREPREVDISSWPFQAQHSGLAGIFLSLTFLLIFAAQVSWWLPVPTLAIAIALWLLARLLPRLVRLALEVIGIVAWPWGIVLAFATTEQIVG